MEVRLQTTERRAAWAERVAGVDPDQLELLQQSKATEPRDDAQSNPKTGPSQPSRPFAANGADRNSHPDRSHRVVG